MATSDGIAALEKSGATPLTQPIQEGLIQ